MVSVRLKLDVQSATCGLRSSKTASHKYKLIKSVQEAKVPPRVHPKAQKGFDQKESGSY